ncbi:MULTISPECIES: hypothetical protein [Nostoc]|uniref:Uncharacterized protein n=2 Tax=Nostoc TaxID=1177 RepID=A0ABR8IEW6_9NOSO|nr:MULTISPECIES: hypothetical protein [Nostoc]MBD2564551.1 hypothetical protein [Nostoc linckia FACHB-391]MBD2650105.1 hypothetical protein [Nostoc foliaceum FACHB-393]
MYSSSDRLDTAKQLQSAQRVTAQLEAEVKQLRQANNQLEQVNNQLETTNQQLQQEKAVKDEVISHNAKFGMENKKDPSNPASYANKGKDTDKILLLINEEFLSGEGFKAGRN